MLHCQIVEPYSRIDLTRVQKFTCRDVSYSPDFSDNLQRFRGLFFSVLCMCWLKVRVSSRVMPKIFGVGLYLIFWPLISKLSINEAVSSRVNTVPSVFKKLTFILHSLHQSTELPTFLHAVRTATKRSLLVDHTVASSTYLQ